MKRGGGRSSRWIIICTTSTLHTNESNWGGRGSPGFFVHLFSLDIRSTYSELCFLRAFFDSLGQHYCGSGNIELNQWLLCIFMNPFEAGSMGKSMKPHFLKTPYWAWQSTELDKKFQASYLCMQYWPPPPTFWEIIGCYNHQQVS